MINADNSLPIIEKILPHCKTVEKVIVISNKEKIPKSVILDPNFI